MEMQFEELEIIATNITVNNAPIHANNGIYAKYIPNIIAIITIKPEPAEIPSKKGPAKPFLNKDCNKPPDAPKADPTSIAATVLGNRTCHNIRPFISLPLPKS